MMSRLVRRYSRRGLNTAAVLISLLICGPSATADEWHTLFDGGFKLPVAGAWVSELTRSELTPDGLHIIDPSTERSSGCYYTISWNARPQQEATVEIRLKSISCSGGSGVTLAVSDGIHRDGITFFPDRIVFDWSKLSAAFDCADGFHDYTICFKGIDIKLYADGKLLIDGTGKFTTAAFRERNELGFGAGSSGATSEAIWQLVRFRGAKVDLPEIETPEIPGLQVKRGRTQLIVPKKRFVGMFKFADGDIVVDGRRSSDGGKTWQQAEPFSVGAYQFPDRLIVDLRTTARTQITDHAGVFEVPIFRSNDNGKTVSTETALMNIPEGTGGTGDDGKSHPGPLCDHAIVALRDGSLLAGMYGYFKTDTVLCETFPKEWKVYKYRSFVMRSRDRGKTWDYLATVAYDPTIGYESFCEPDLLVLPDGDILCFMRTGGSGNRHTPLYLSRSTDDGKTWSKPVPVADRGVWPNACMMKNGVIVCTYGRPDNWLMFSLDQGKTWVGHFRFHHGTSTSYNSIEEVAPNKLLVVYDRDELDADGRVKRDVLGTYFTVELGP